MIFTSRNRNRPTPAAPVARKRPRPARPRFLAGMLLGLLGLAALPAPVARAQGLFSPVAQVNDDAITGYELAQRIALLKALGSTGELRKRALEKLIDERLQLQAARAAGIAPGEEEIRAGVDEFAARADLSGEEFLAMLAGKGVAAESFMDFVRAGLSWRSLIRAKFGPRVQITEADLDRAIALEGSRAGIEVLISEIFLPTNTPNNAAITAELAPQIARLNTLEAFADAARRFSAGASRDRGGRVDRWLPIENLPAALRPLILKMNPGEVSPPIEIPNAVALFQLRARREGRPPAAKAEQVVEYSTWDLPARAGNADARALAARITARVESCTDLVGLARSGIPGRPVRHESVPLASVPADIALLLARLDPGEAATEPAPDGKGGLRLVMLCERRFQAEPPDRDALRERLISQRLEALAEAYLGELRGNAHIERP